MRKGKSIRQGLEVQMLRSAFLVVSSYGYMGFISLHQFIEFFFTWAHVFWYSPLGAYEIKKLNKQKKKPITNIYKKTKKPDTKKKTQNVQKKPKTQKEKPKNEKKKPNSKKIKKKKPQKPKTNLKEKDLLIS